MVLPTTAATAKPWAVNAFRNLRDVLMSLAANEKTQRCRDESLRLGTKVVPRHSLKWLGSAVVSLQSLEDHGRNDDKKQGDWQS